MKISKKIIILITVIFTIVTTTVSAKMGMNIYDVVGVLIIGVFIITACTFTITHYE